MLARWRGCILASYSGALSLTGQSWLVRSRTLLETIFEWIVEKHGVLFVTLQCSAVLTEVCSRLVIIKKRCFYMRLFNSRAYTGPVCYLTYFVVDFSVLRNFFCYDFLGRNHRGKAKVSLPPSNNVFTIYRNQNRVYTFCFSRFSNFSHEHFERYEL